MFQSYEQIFSKRADAYQEAMELYPAARDREFLLAVEFDEIPESVIQGVEDSLGYMPEPAKINLAWSLGYIMATRHQ